MTYKALQTNFERELLFHLIFNMKQGRTSSARAREIAREFLSVLKAEEDAQGFMNSLSKKAEYYPEMRSAFLTVASEFEKEMVDENLERVRNMLKGGIN